MVKLWLIHLNRKLPSYCLVEFSFQDGTLWGLLVRSRVELGKESENWALISRLD